MNMSIQISPTYIFADVSVPRPMIHDGRAISYQSYATFWLSLCTTDSRLSVLAITYITLQYDTIQLHKYFGLQEPTLRSPVSTPAM
jgi:hypothetical protein